MSLQTVIGAEGEKAELQHRIAALEEERATLTRDIESLREAISVRQLRSTASHIQSEVDALRAEKTGLQEQLSTFPAPDSSPAPVN